jgi:hypothetical protein
MGLWAIFSISDMGDVGFLAHVGGFVFGVVVAFGVRRIRFEERFVDRGLERRETVHDASAVEDAMALADDGRSAQAMEQLKGVLSRNPRDPDAAAALWNIAVRTGHPERVAPVVLRAVEAAVRSGETDLPAQLWGDIVSRCPELEVDLRLAVRSAELLLRDGMFDDVRATLRWLTPRANAGSPQGLLVRLARLADELEVSAPFASLALERGDLSSELENELQRFKGCSE